MAKPELAADNTEAAAEKPKRINKPRPLYLLFNLPEGINPDQVELVDVTRRAEDALEAIDTGKAQAYKRVMLK